MVKVLIRMTVFSFMLVVFNSPALGASINCKAVSTDDVERAICAHKNLLDLDKSISSQLGRLMNQCSSSADLLRNGQVNWIADRNDCRNIEGAFSVSGALRSCIEKKMKSRLADLNAIGPTCNLEILAASYPFVNVDYITRFGKDYLGKNVSVFGVLRLESCSDTSASPTLAWIESPKSSRSKFRVLFSTIDADDRTFLCEQAPVAHWKGIVKHDAAGHYLYLTDILGKKLSD